uniref:carboxypeptidase-like regulatory domain-containing protein n=1 Tax=Rhizomonospora bruguierae TaxID=1581705 RepID=UPI0020BD5B05
TRTTSSTGTYSFTGIAAGTYDVTATSGGSGCAGQIATTEVDVQAAVTIDLLLAPQSDIFGYTCHTVPGTAFVAGTTQVPPSGDDTPKVLGPFTLPFTLPYYGRSYDRLWVSTQGVVTFHDPQGWMPYDQVSLPDRANAPLAAVLPFWDNLYMDAQASVWTGTIGSGSTQQFVIEWRNIVHYGGTARFSFEVLLSPSGDVTFNYSGMANDRSKGSSAAIGITSPGGGYGLQYAFQSPVLAAGTAVTFVYPDDPWPIPTGSISGTVLRKGTPVGGAEVRLGGLRGYADSAGHYEFGDLETGTYGLEVYQGCDAANQPDVLVDGDAVVNLDLTTYYDDFGYSCTLEQEKWIPGNTVVPGGWADIDLPFPFPFYGRRWTMASIGAGSMYLIDSSTESIGGDIEFWPGANPISDANSGTFTAVVGTAPNRQFVIEARNYNFGERPDLRLSWEMIFGEDGSMKMIFKDPPDPTAVPYTESVWSMPEDYDGISYYEDGFGFPAGKSVVIHPPTPS